MALIVQGYIAAISFKKMFAWKIPYFEVFCISSCIQFLAYLGQYKSKSFIQGHFCKLEIKGFHLAPRLIGFYALLMKILAPKKRTKNAMLFARPCTSFMEKAMSTLGCPFALYLNSPFWKACLCLINSRDC